MVLNRALTECRGLVSHLLQSDPPRSVLHSLLIPSSLLPPLFILGALLLAFVLVLKRRRRTLAEEEVMNICWGHTKTNRKFIISEETFRRMSHELETYVRLLGLIASGKIKVSRRTAKRYSR